MAEPAIGGAGAGRRLVQASWAGVLVHLAVAAVAAVADTTAAHAAHLAVASVLFAGGAVAMGAAIVLAANRSRNELIGIGGLFFAAGSAPPRTGRSLQVALALSAVATIAAAAARPFTPLAFAVLVPIWPLGLMGLWCSRHGAFGSRS